MRDSPKPDGHQMVSKDPVPGIDFTGHGASCDGFVVQS